MWETIKEAKKGRALVLTTHSIEESNTLSVLTTHSIEEANTLGERIGFVAKGRLYFIGTPIRLKSCFGIANIQRGLATLKEAFSNISKKAELEETIAVEEGGLELLE